MNCTWPRTLESDEEVGCKGSRIGLSVFACAAESGTQAPDAEQAVSEPQPCFPVYFVTGFDAKAQAGLEHAVFLPQPLR